MTIFIIQVNYFWNNCLRRIDFYLSFLMIQGQFVLIMDLIQSLYICSHPFIHSFIHPLIHLFIHLYTSIICQLLFHIPKQNNIENILCTSNSIEPKALNNIDLPQFRLFLDSLKKKNRKTECKVWEKSEHGVWESMEQKLNKQYPKIQRKNVTREWIDSSKTGEGLTCLSTDELTYIHIILCKSILCIFRGFSDMKKTTLSSKPTIQNGRSFLLSVTSFPSRLAHWSPIFKGKLEVVLAKDPFQMA